MKSLILSAAVFIVAAMTAQAQSYQFEDEFWMPTGSAHWSGNRWQFEDEFGMPTGSAHWSGNRWQYEDQFGMPTGSSRYGH